MREVRENRNLVRGAICLAIAAAAQLLRVAFPFIPPLASMFVIGTVVNLCLVLAVWSSSLKYAAIMSFLLPLFAYLQGAMPLVPMVGVIFLGNLVLCLVAGKAGGWKLLILGPLTKTMVLWGGTGIVADLFHFPAKVAFLLQVRMGYPQLITAFLGILLARFLWSRLGLGRN